MNRPVMTRRRARAVLRLTHFMVGEIDSLLADGDQYQRRSGEDYAETCQWLVELARWELGSKAETMR